MGWFASGYLAYANDEKGIHVLVGGFIAEREGIHLNFLIVLVIAMILTAIAGMIIGLPTLRLRGDYIAIVTLAFGEIIGRLAVNLDSVKIGETAITAGRQGISPVDRIDLPFLDPFTGLNLKPWYWFALFLVAVVLFVNFRLRDSRMGRAWVALREDEIAAVAMGVPAVKTKLMAYASGAAFGGISGAYLASLLNTVNADQFQFSFSILVLAMIILGGLGSIWGVVIGAITLSILNNYLIPDVINDVAEQDRPGLRHDADHVRGLRVPAVDDDDPAPAGPAPGAAAQDGARRSRRRYRRPPPHGTAMSATQTTARAPSLANPAVLDAVNITKQFGGLTAVRTSRSRCRRSRSSRSSGPTARARRRSSTCSRASTARRWARSRSTGATSRAPARTS